MKLLSLLLTLEDCFDIEIKDEHAVIIYSGKVDDIPFSFLKKYCYFRECTIKQIWQSPKCDMAIYIDGANE